MKIPIGFELGTKCQLQINAGTDSEPKWKYFYFYHYGSDIKCEEVGHFFRNVNNNNVKITDKYHLEFDLKLIDKNYYDDQGSQDSLSKFLSYYYDNNITWENHDENQCFILYFYMPSGNDYINAMRMLVLAKRPPKRRDIKDEDETIGQYIEIKAITKEALTPKQMHKFWSLYRESEGSTAWGSWLIEKNGWVIMRPGQVSAV